MNTKYELVKTTDVNKSLPLLIYDGQCGFCVYWARYWQKLTGNKVQYSPYQEVAAQYPEIPLEDFQNGVQYIAPDGQIAKNAEASYLTLSNAPGKSYWLGMYRKLPGFAFIAEKSYTLISRHRNFFYFFSILLWGRNYEPPRFDIISWLFLRGLGCIYLFAFVSFASQALGLIGSHGIFPVAELTTVAKYKIGGLAYWYLPMVFWFNASDLAVQIVAWGGAVFALMLILNLLPRLSLFFLFIFYLSLSVAGQTFMSFQWDMFLLEAGVLAIFLFGSTRVLGIWLLRWLLFRFIFAGGLVKILSGDPTWPSFTALYYYFETEPIPTPLAWYAHHLPHALLSIATASALFIELFAVFLIFFPRHLRFVGAFAILSLQTIIALTGNYNFFNLETMLLCLVLFDDAAIKKILPNAWLRRIPQDLPRVARRKFISFAAYSFIFITVSASLVEFELRFVGHELPSPLVWMTNAIAPLRFVNVYGPFAVITKPRYEIIIEGSDDDVNWREYGFKYKPGDVNRKLSWIIPHQPRIDWQMWFAALGSAQDNPWFERLMLRILQNSPDVMPLLGENPFPEHAPKYLRANLYEYHFTTPAERTQTGAIWTRERVGMFMPEMQLN
jgi:predicted DCC family thiol-disulfide oxidoreductase YuxK